MTKGRFSFKVDKEKDAQSEDKGNTNKDEIFKLLDESKQLMKILASIYLKAIDK